MLVSGIPDLLIFPKTGCKIVGYKDDLGNYIINPDESKIMEANCCIFILGQPHQIEALQKIHPQH